jgi:probable F420-dependent oxidoreductase
VPGAGHQEHTMREIKFGIAVPIADFAKTRAMAERAEALGFYSVSVPDHLLNTFGKRLPQLECYTSLTGIALVTKRVRLLPLVTAMSYRNPTLLGKITSSLDHISGGRLIAGLGSGWLRREYDAFGYPYPTNAERIEQLAEGVEVLKAMWTQEEPRYQGRHFSIDKAYNFPKPVQKPHPPILIGGAGSRVLKVAARLADILNVIAPVTRGAVDFKESARFDKPDLKRRIAMLHRYAREAGRDPDAIELSSLSTTFVSADKSQADEMAKRAAANMGLPDAEGARNFPMLLTGTPEEVRREIRSRIEEFNLTYFIVSFLSDDSFELFARQVMPEFASH